MTGARPLRLGTRASDLAMTQSGLVADALRTAGAEVELVTIRTLGDQRPPDTTWGEGAFVGALETALLAGDVDLAVHSAKDVPTTEDPRLVIAAYPHREDPRDALVGREPRLTLATLPRGSRVGTDSPRRTAFLRAYRPDLRVHPLHGNVDTRLRRLDAGETDALILAVAGLSRLGLTARIGEVIPPDVVPPAPGQGALAIQCRANDAATRAWVGRLDDADTRTAVEAERAFLQASGGGCRAPIGGLARIDAGEVVLIGGSAGITAPDASGPDGDPPPIVWGETRGPQGDHRVLAAGLAARLAEALAEAEGPERRSGPPRVLVTRAAGQATSLVAVLRDAGCDVVAIPTIDIEPVGADGPLDAAVSRLESYDWTVVTSANGAHAIADAIARTRTDPAATRWAAVGGATRGALDERGIDVAWTPSRADGLALADALPMHVGATILLPRADLADARLPDRLRERGATVDEVVAYRTVEAPETSRVPLSEAIAAGRLDAIVFTSGSTVRGLLALLTPAERRVALRATAWCIGPQTAGTARASGFGHVIEAPAQSTAALADAIAGALLPAIEPATDLAPAAPTEVTR